MNIFFSCSCCGAMTLSGGAEDENLLVPEDPTIRLCGTCMTNVFPEEDVHALFCMTCRRIRHSITFNGPLTTEKGEKVNAMSLIGKVAFIRECVECHPGLDMNGVRILTRDKVFGELNG